MRWARPFYNPNLFLYWSLWSAARDCGVRVLLDGQIGDVTATHGYVRLNELARSWRWLTLASEFTAYAKLQRFSPWPMIVQMIWRDGIKRGSIPRKGALPPAARILNPEFVQRTGAAERITAAHALANEQFPTERETHLRDLNSGIIPMSIEVYARGIAAFGLEARFPYLDRRLVEFCLSLPSDRKFRDGWNRWMVREAFKGILPEKVRLRTDKGDLGHNFNRGLRTFDLPLVRDVINDPSRIEPFVDVGRLRRALERVEAGNDNDAVTLWSVVVLDAWLRRA